MIFSTDRCPLCNQKLKLEIIDGSSGKVAFLYYCEKREITRNESNTSSVAVRHYENRSYQGGELSFMIIPPFELMHSQAKKLTSVRAASPYQPKKIIFEVPLLDLDYSKTHLVIDKIKLLTLFS